MMKYLILFILIGMIFMTSCSKNNVVKVAYQTSGAISDYNLNYLNEDGDLVQTLVETQSIQDKWTYSFNAEKGDIVYVSGKYSDINSGLNIMIKVDGKVYKQASNQGDTLKFLTVSGVVPIE